MRKGFTIIEVIIFVVMMGLLLAIFVPASLKVREKAKEDAITYNINRIISASENYLKDREEKEVEYSKLVSEGYIEEIEPVAGETYKAIKLKAEGGILELETPWGNVIKKDY